MFTNINRWLSERMFLCVLTALMLGYFISLSSSPAYHKAVMVLFAYMTFITASGTSFREFLHVLKVPRMPLYILSLVHLTFPLIAWIFGMSFFPDQPLIRFGFLIGAAIPIGVTSIMWTSIVNGNVAVSLVAVTLDTLAAPIILPLYFTFIMGTQISVNYSQMTSDLFFMITLPSLLGMLLCDLTNSRTKAFSKGLGGLTSKIALFIVIFFNASFIMPSINWNIEIIKIIAVCFMMVVSGYLLGWAGSFVLSKPSRETTLTMMYNTGMRNTASGLIIALTYFPPSVSIPITLTMIFQQPIAAIIPHIYAKFKTEFVKTVKI
jgi:predicted Na+-dependent transporter